MLNRTPKGAYSPIEMHRRLSSGPLLEDLPDEIEEFEDVDHNFKYLIASLIAGTLFCIIVGMVVLSLHVSGAFNDLVSKNLKCPRKDMFYLTSETPESDKGIYWCHYTSIKWNAEMNQILQSNVFCFLLVVTFGI